MHLCTIAVLTLGGGRGGGPLGKANAAAVATPATRNAVAITTNIFSSQDWSSLSGSLNIPLLYISWRSSLPVSLSTFLEGGSKVRVNM